MFKRALSTSDAPPVPQKDAASTAASPMYRSRSAPLDHLPSSSGNDPDVQRPQPIISSSNGDLHQQNKNGRSATAASPGAAPGVDIGHEDGRNLHGSTSLEDTSNAIFLTSVPTGGLPSLSSADVQSHVSEENSAVDSEVGTRHATADGDLLEGNDIAGSDAPSDTAQEARDAVEALGTKLVDSNQRTRSLEQPGAARAIALTVMSPQAQEAVEKVVEGIATFLHDCPALITAAEALANAHPAITAVVATFKVVYSLWTEYRDNDQRVRSVYVSMSEIVRILLQLGGRDRNVNAEADLRGLVEETSKDMKTCANVCETYLQKSTIAKVFMGKVAAKDLADWIAKFAQRKLDFQFTMTVYLVQQTDAIRADTSNTKQQVDFLVKLNLQWLAKFQEMQPQEEQQVEDKIQSLGGIDVIRHDDKRLKLLLDQHEPPSQQSTDCAPGESKPGTRAPLERDGQLLIKDGQRFLYHNKRPNIRELKRELAEGWERAVEKNWARFDSKFEDLKIHASTVTHEEHDRLIKAISEGPHEQIEHEALKALWKEMNWRRVVKTRTFVLTLRENFDYIVAKVLSVQNTGSGSDRSSEVAGFDGWTWAYEYMTHAYLQSIMEAFDDDGSGFVTIDEVNRFVKALPPELNWSLPHWIAYWAIGWQVTSAKYCEKILDIFAHMFAARTEILPENRHHVDYYLVTVWRTAAELVLSFHQPSNVPDGLEAKFRGYLEFEEDRIAKKLRAEGYNIPAIDTVFSIASPTRAGVGVNGGVRMEKYVFPMLYLMLKKDLQLLQLAKTKVLHDEELFNASWKTFGQQKLDVTNQMRIFAHSMFYYHHSDNLLWSMREFQTREYSSPSGDAVVQELLDEKELVEFPTKQRWSARMGEYPSMTDDLPAEARADTERRRRLYVGLGGANTEADERAGPPLRDTLGLWSGYLYDNEDYPCNDYMMMISFFAHVSASGDSEFCGDGYSGGKHFDVKGTCDGSSSDGDIPVKFTINLAGDAILCEGRVRAGEELIGTAALDWWPDIYPRMRFIFRHTPPDVMCHRPHPKDLDTDYKTRRRLLWDFAIRAVCAQRRSWKWSRSAYAKRRDNRLRMIELDLMEQWSRYKTAEETAEYRSCARTMSSGDSNLYGLFLRRRALTIPRQSAYCDNCMENVGPVRSMCIDCLADDVDCWGTVDLCTSAKCLQSTFALPRFEKLGPHIPEHDIARFRTVMIPTRDMPELYRRAKTAVDRARSEFCAVPDLATGAQGETSGDGHSLHSASHRGHENSRDVDRGESSRTSVEFVPEKSPSTASAEAQPDAAVQQESLGSTREPHLDALQQQPLAPDTADSQSEAAPSVQETCCAVCGEVVQQPCWFCVDCCDESVYAYFCEACERKSLLRCTNFGVCKNIFVQPTWYYSEKLCDNFLCNTCDAKRPKPSVPRDHIRHTWTHVLVRCSKRRDVDKARPPTLEDKMNGLHDKFATLSDKLEALNYKIDQRMSSLQGRIVDSLGESSTGTIQHRLRHLEESVTKIAVALEGVLPLVTSRHEKTNGHH